MKRSDLAVIALGVMSVLSPGVAGAAEVTVLASMGVVSVSAMLRPPSSVPPVTR